MTRITHSSRFAPLCPTLQSIYDTMDTRYSVSMRSSNFDSEALIRPSNSWKTDLTDPNKKIFKKNNNNNISER